MSIAILNEAVVQRLVQGLLESAAIDANGKNGLRILAAHEFAPNQPGDGDADQTRPWAKLIGWDLADNSTNPESEHAALSVQIIVAVPDAITAGTGGDAMALARTRIRKALRRRFVEGKRPADADDDHGIEINGVSSRSVPDAELPAHAVAMIMAEGRAWRVSGESIG